MAGFVANVLSTSEEVGFVSHMAMGGTGAHRYPDRSSGPAPEFELHETMTAPRIVVGTANLMCALVALICLAAPAPLGVTVFFLVTASAWVLLAVRGFVFATIKADTRGITVVNYWRTYRCAWTEVEGVDAPVSSNGQGRGGRAIVIRLRGGRSTKQSAFWSPDKASPSGEVTNRSETLAARLTRTSLNERVTELIAAGECVWRPAELSE